MACYGIALLYLYIYSEGPAFTLDNGNDRSHAYEIPVVAISKRNEQIVNDFSVKVRKWNVECMDPVKRDTR
jgi:hypothetical protein